jgi:hypothetical protein
MRLGSPATIGTVNRDRLVMALIVLFAVPWALGSFYFILEGGGSDTATFYMWAGWFLILAFGFLEIKGLKQLAWCSAPVLVTLRAVVEFLCVPIWRVISGEDLVDGFYSKAMLFVLTGFVVFWAGSWMMMRHSQLRFRPDFNFTKDRVVVTSALLFAIGASTKVAMWKLGLNSYMADEMTRTSAAPVMQWFGTAASLLQASLLISSIEFVGKKSTSLGIQIIFWLSFVLCLGFGLISGMKSEILEPVLLVILVMGIARGRFPRIGLVLPLLLVLIYPVVIAYRNNLNEGYRGQANTVSGLSALLQKSVEDATTTRTAARGGAVNTGVENTSSRLSLLSLVRDVISLPSPSLINGDEHLWMAPVYPFIPRILWKSKPVLNKGQRFSIALGLSRDTSTALTPIGDLYTLGGLPGIIAGMFIYGLCLQLFMNWMSKEFSEKALFFFLSVLLPITNLELDVFSLITYSISAVLIGLLLSNLVYGGPIFGFRTWAPARAHSPRRINTVFAGGEAQ